MLFEPLGLAHHPEIIFVNIFLMMRKSVNFESISKANYETSYLG